MEEFGSDIQVHLGIKDLFVHMIKIDLNMSKLLHIFLDQDGKILNKTIILEFLEFQSKPNFLMVEFNNGDVAFYVLVLKVD